MHVLLLLLLLWLSYCLQVEREQYISQLISSPRDVISETFALRWGSMSEVAASVRLAGEGKR